MGDLIDRVAIVTGGGAGIGAAYSDALAGAGAEVVIADIADPGQLARSLQKRHHGRRITGLCADVSEEDAVRDVIREAMALHGRVDILVNNAAIFASLPPADVTEIDVDLWDRVMAVNVRSAFLMVKHLAPHMIAAGYGKIINITSGVAYKGLPGMSHYAASKGALTTLTRAWSRELGPYGILVNSLAPGATYSDTITANTAHVERYHANAQASRALKRDAYPADLIGALLFLASRASDFVTGQTLAVDGGSVNT